MLSNAYFLAKFRFDTAENETAKNLQKFARFAKQKLLILLNLLISGRRSGLSPGREEAQEELQPVDDQEGPLDQDEDPEGSLVVADFDFELHADRDAVDADHLRRDLKK